MIGTILIVWCVIAVILFILYGLDRNVTIDTSDLSKLTKGQVLFMIIIHPAIVTMKLLELVVRLFVNKW